MNVRSVLAAVAVAGVTTLSAATFASAGTTSPHATAPGRAAVHLRGFRPAAGIRVPGIRPARLNLRSPQNVSTSRTWSGYAALGYPNVSMRFVAGDWTVPSLNSSRCVPGTSGFAYATHLIGLDGWGSQTVEEIGTFAYCQSDGTVTYQAFYEMYPDQANVYSGINPGDAITASVYYSASAHDYNLVLTDVTSGNQINATATCPAGSVCHNISAEAITAVPGGGPAGGVNLADFGMINYTGAAVTSLGGLRGTLAPSKLWTSVQINMTDSSGVRMATPSPLYGGQAFNDTWNAAS